MDKVVLKKLVGQKVKAFRLREKLTQVVLGQKTGVNQRQISLIEDGKSMPSLDTLIKLAEIFECDVSEFFETQKDLNLEGLKLEISSSLDKLTHSELLFVNSILKQFILMNLNKEKQC